VGKASRDKGARNERNLVNELRAHGFEAERVPLSGAAGGQFTGDIILEGMRFEAKVRASGFATLRRWLGGHDGLFVKADRMETLVVLTMARFMHLLSLAKGNVQNVQPEEGEVRSANKKDAG